jgi:hypothetical protein
MTKAGVHFNAESNPKKRAYDDFKPRADRYVQELTMQKLSRQEILFRIKEIYSHIETIEAADGKLEEQEELDVHNAGMIFGIAQLQQKITADELRQAELPFTTVTGRRTATPVFPSRFDA